MFCIDRLKKRAIIDDVMIEGASDDPLAMTTLNNGDDKMTDVNNMLNAYHWELTAGEYTDGGQTDSLLKIAERVNGLDDAHRYSQTLKISVCCKYECGDVVTLTMDARGKLQGNRKSSHTQQILLHYIGK